MRNKTWEKFEAHLDELYAHVRNVTQGLEEEIQSLNNRLALLENTLDDIVYPVDNMSGGDVPPR